MKEMIKLLFPMGAVANTLLPQCYIIYIAFSSQRKISDFLDHRHNVDLALNNE